MKTPKFRVWYKPGKQWVNHIALLDCQGGAFSHAVRVEDNDLKTTQDIIRAFSPADVVVQQFTGLIDNVGKEIYEGDIVTEDVEYEGREAMSPTISGVETGVIVWEREKHGWGIDKRSKETGELNRYGVPWFTSGSCYKVIGNICENKNQKL